MNNLIKFVLFTMVFTMAFGFYIPASNAGAVTVRLGVGTTPGIPFDIVENQASAEVAALTAAEVHIRFPSSAEFGIGDSVTILASTPLVISNTCGTQTTDADLDGTADGGAVVTGNQYQYTFTAATTAASGVGSVDFCIAVAAIATGNYSFSMGAINGSGTGQDYGAALLYVGDANDITVTAFVLQAELEFKIRNAADTADQNVCNLGTLNTGNVSTCNYRLKVRTTATNGYSISWTSDGDLDQTSAPNYPIASTGVSTPVVAGTEAYGVQFYAGANTDGGACTAQNIWAAAPDDPVSTTPKNLVICTKANLPAGSGATTYTHLMDHKASIDGSTPFGDYDQVVTYYVTGSF